MSVGLRSRARAMLRRCFSPPAHLYAALANHGIEAERGAGQQRVGSGLVQGR